MFPCEGIDEPTRLVRESQSQGRDIHVCSDDQVLSDLIGRFDFAGTPSLQEANSSTTKKKPKGGTNYVTETKACGRFLAVLAHGWFY